jgi:hypothetical protein
MTATAPPEHDLDALTGPALRTFFNIAVAWRLSEPEQKRLLGLESCSTLEAWKSGEVRAIPQEALERISYIVGIYQALQVLLPANEAADAWVRKPNAAPLFSGRSALECMTSGDIAALAAVRRYLEAWAA